jgi:four helix bundle protein
MEKWFVWAAELEYHSLLARDLRLIREQEYRSLERQADELQQMLTGLMRKFQPAKV